MMTIDKPVTVAQACRILGVSERTLRRILRQPEMQAQTLAEHRRTATGVRRSLLLPPLLVEQLLNHMIEAEDGGLDSVPNGGNNTRKVQANGGISLEGATLAYERLLAEQEARILDLQTALAHERQRNRELSAALTTLRQENADRELGAQKSVSVKRKWFGHGKE